MAKRYNEKKARLAQEAIDRELDTGYGAVDVEAVLANDVRDAAMGKGEEELFERKMTKEERKAAAKAAREAKRKAKQSKKGGDKDKEPTSVKSELDLQALDINDDGSNSSSNKADAALDQLSKDNIVVTYEAKKGKLHANTRDINVGGVTVSFHGKPLIEETQLVINYGNRYGFIGK